MPPDHILSTSFDVLYVKYAISIQVVTNVTAAPMEPNKGIIDEAIKNPKMEYSTVIFFISRSFFKTNNLLFPYETLTDKRKGPGARIYINNRLLSIISPNNR